MSDRAVELRSTILGLATEEQRRKYERFFPGDTSFVGARMGDVFGVAKANLDLPTADLEALLSDDVHEVRVLACSVMGKAATHRSITPARHEALYDLVLRRHDRIDAWDLVDLVAHQVVGSWLVDRSTAPLAELAGSEAWYERRTAVVATGAFIRRGETGPTFDISRLLFDDPEPLVHKGAGWMLRWVGDVDRPALVAFLDEHAAAMPRPMLRAAIEKLEPPVRKAYLAAGR